MKTLALMLLLAVMALGQTPGVCKACPGTPALDTQFPRTLPKPRKPEKAKLQKPPKSHRKGKKAPPHGEAVGGRQ